MLKHPISALVRLLPALMWLVVIAYCGTFSLSVLANQALGANEWSALYILFALGFLAVAVYGAIQAYREFKRVLPALRADTPIRIGFPRKRRPPAYVPTRHPMAEALRGKLRQMIEGLEGAGALQTGEVAFDDVLLCAEMDDEYSDIDIYNVVRVLSALAWQRKRPFANLAFFMDSVEYATDDAVTMVREFARLCDRTAELGAVEVQGIDGGKIIPAGRGTFPPANAVVEFDLGGSRCSVPFTMYYKNLPMGLMEGLASAFALPADSRRFARGGYDESVVSYLEPEKVTVLNRKLSPDFDHFQLLH